MKQRKTDRGKELKRRGGNGCCCSTGRRETERGRFFLCMEVYLVDLAYSNRRRTHHVAGFFKSFFFRGGVLSVLIINFELVRTQLSFELDRLDLDHARRAFFSSNLPTLHRGSTTTSQQLLLQTVFDGRNRNAPAISQAGAF